MRIIRADTWAHTYNKFVTGTRMMKRRSCGVLGKRRTYCLYSSRGSGRGGREKMLGGMRGRARGWEQRCVGRGEGGEVLMSSKQGLVNSGADDRRRFLLRTVPRFNRCNMKQAARAEGCPVESIPIPVSSRVVELLPSYASPFTGRHSPRPPEKKPPLLPLLPLCCVALCVEFE